MNLIFVTPFIPIQLYLKRFFIVTRTSFLNINQEVNNKSTVEDKHLGVSKISVDSNRSNESDRTDESSCTEISLANSSSSEDHVIAGHGTNDYEETPGMQERQSNIHHATAHNDGTFRQQEVIAGHGTHDYEETPGMQERQSNIHHATAHNDGTFRQQEISNFQPLDSRIPRDRDSSQTTPKVIAGHGTNDYEETPGMQERQSNIHHATAHNDGTFRQQEISNSQPLASRVPRDRDSSHTTPKVIAGHSTHDYEETPGMQECYIPHATAYNNGTFQQQEISNFLPLASRVPRDRDSSHTTPKSRYQRGDRYAKYDNASYFADVGPLSLQSTTSREQPPPLPSAWPTYCYLEPDLVHRDTEWDQSEPKHKSCSIKRACQCAILTAIFLGISIGVALSTFNNMNANNLEKQIIEGNNQINNTLASSLKTFSDSFNETIVSVQNDSHTLLDETSNLRNQTETSIRELRTKSLELSEELKVFNDAFDAALISLKNDSLTLRYEISSLRNETDTSMQELKTVVLELFEEFKRNMTAYGTNQTDNQGGGSGSGSGGQCYNSTTKGCVDHCDRMCDGDYQSCETCNGYVTCANRKLHPRDCPNRFLVWDDQTKTCESVSSTC